MSVVSSPSERPAAKSGSKVIVDGGASVRFENSYGKTILKDLYQRDPVRILFPNNPPDEIVTGVLTTTSGGLVGGDVIKVSVDAGDDTRSMVVAQAAEKVYRSTGADCLIDITVRAAEGAWFEWLPQETILHQGARMRRTTRLELTGGARVLAGEILVFGRHAMGEQMTEGLVRECWQISRDGRAMWADAFYLDGNLDQVIGHAAGLRGAAGIASAVYVAPDADRDLMLARDLLAEHPRIKTAATLVNGVLLVRWLGHDVFSMRNAFGEFWRKFRYAVGGHPENLPRLWDV